jgi:hypothetical protein
MQMLKITSISPSRIKTYQMCRFKYWLTYHCPDIKLKSNWGASHGSLIHNILENYSNGTDLDWTTRLYRGYAGKLEEENKEGKMVPMESPLVWATKKDYKDKSKHCDVCPYALTENATDYCSISQKKINELDGCPRSLFEGSVSMLTTVIDRYANTWKKILKNKEGVIIGTEYAYKIPITGTDVPIVGIMDLVIEEDKDTIHIIDYKSGSWAQNYFECRDDIQVRMYSLAARREFIDDVSNKGYKYKNIILTFDYFTASPITLAFSQEEDLKTENEVSGIVNQIQSTETINRIVKNNSDFEDKKFWKCRSLCDSKVCAEQWKGPFAT